MLHHRIYLRSLLTCTLPAVANMKIIVNSYCTLLESPMYRKLAALQYLNCVSGMRRGHRWVEKLLITSPSGRPVSYTRRILVPSVTSSLMVPETLWVSCSTPYYLLFYSFVWIYLSLFLHSIQFIIVPFSLYLFSFVSHICAMAITAWLWHGLHARCMMHLKFPSRALHWSLFSAIGQKLKKVQVKVKISYVAYL